MKFAFLLKIWLIFNMFYYFGMFVTNILHISGASISESKEYCKVIPSVHYFYVKIKMLADFQICISVHLNLRNDIIINTSKAILDLHLYGFNGYIRKREDPVAPDMFCKKGVLGNLAKFTEKHLCQSLF